MQIGEGLWLKKTSSLDTQIEFMPTRGAPDLNKSLIPIIWTQIEELCTSRSYNTSHFFFFFQETKRYKTPFELWYFEKKKKK